MRISVLALLFFYFSYVQSQTFTGYRPPTINAARDLITWQYDLCLSLHNNSTTPAGTLVNTFQIERSFRPYEIMQHLFGIKSEEERLSLRISGSQIAPCNSGDLCADSFLLPSDFSTTIFMKPRISTILFAPNGIWQWPFFKKNLYLQVILPILSAHYTLALQEQIQNPGTPAPELYKNFSSFARGCPLADSDTAQIIPLFYSRLSPCDSRRVGLAHVTLAAGYGPYVLPHVIGVITGFFSFPTGTRYAGHYLFDAFIGNGHHYELGIGTYGFIDVWESCDNRQSARFLYSFNFSHLFPTHQIRSFDLKNRINSRYMFARHTSTLTTLFAPVSYLTHEYVRVSVTLQADLAFLLMYQHDNTRWYVGYHFYGRSRDHIIHDTPPLLTAMPWTLLEPPDTSTPARVLTPSDINYDSGSTQALSHALVGSFDHTWYYHECPVNQLTLSLGAQADFGAKTYSAPLVTPIQNCFNNALSLWSLWFNARILF